MEKQFQFRSIQVKALREYIQSEEFSTSDHTPISYHRAVSHFKNPRAEEQDIALVAAYKEGKISGYMGMIPDKVFYEGEWRKIAWLSCWWVREEERKSGVGLILLKKAIDCYGKNIILTEFTERAGKIYEKTGEFNVLRKLEGKKYAFLLDKKELEKRMPATLSFVTPLLSATVNNIISVYQFLFRLLYSKKVKYTLVDQIDDQLDDYIEQTRPEEAFKRGKEELNWIIRYPWLLQGDKKKEESRYYFSDFSTEFIQMNVKLLDEKDKIAGFLILTIRDGHLRIPYAFYKEKNQKLVRQLLWSLILEKKVKLLTVYNSKIKQLLSKKPSPVVFSKKTIRTYMIGKQFDPEKFEQQFFQDGDGDCAFT